MFDDEEEFDHTPNVMTLGDLRRALAAADVATLPDDAPVAVMVTDRPGGDVVDEQIITAAGVGLIGLIPTERPGLMLDCDSPPDRYLRSKQDSDS